MLPDAEVLAVQWARNNPAIASVVGNRVATRLPKDPSFPFLTVFRVTGGPDVSDAPLDLPILQWDCYGASRGDASPDYASASQLARTLVSEALEARSTVGTWGVILGMRVISGPRRLDEPVTGWARYVVEMEMMTRELV